MIASSRHNVPIRVSTNSAQMPSREQLRRDRWTFALITLLVALLVLLISVLGSESAPSSVDQFPPWLETLRSLDENLMESDAALVTSATVEQANNIIFSLEEVLQNMLELETYNELVQLVRSILEDQEAIQEKTKKEQKERDRGALLD